MIARLHEMPFGARLARRLQAFYESAPAPVRLRLHGRTALVNPGNTYPLTVARHPAFNAPLVELVHQAAAARKRPVHVVDVGAAIGDTALLLHERCPSDLASILCIEGDDEFFSLLQQNITGLPQVTALKALLARERKEIPSLVKPHPGTASALGEKLQEAVRLDSLEDVQKRPVDALKIDVDGFDGEILMGASTLLASSRPAVIFEWHPVLIQRAGQDPSAAFTALQAAGYTRLLWFHNLGIFSHFSAVPDSSTLSKWVDYLTAVNARADEHFDIVALHAEDPIHDLSLAELPYARQWIR
jgi:FkbM family methyltransferase